MLIFFEFFHSEYIYVGGKKYLPINKSYSRKNSKYMNGPIFLGLLLKFLFQSIQLFNRIIYRVHILKITNNNILV